MEQSPSWEASSYLASKEYPSPFMELEDSLLCSQESAAGPYSEPDASSSHLPTLFPKYPF
jgi:hypothetical protein